MDRLFSQVGAQNALLKADKNLKQRFDQIRSELPPNWEVRLTGDGNFYYVNHKEKTTTWTKP